MQFSFVAIASAILAGSAVATDWRIPADFATIQDAIDSSAVVDGDRICVGPGDWEGALVTKAVEIRGRGGARITSGPAHGSGLIQGFRLLAGSDGASFRHLTFTVDLDIMNGTGVDNVVVEHCRFENAVQAISNWRGSGWTISHNKITDLRTRNGGGIGILIGDYGGGEVKDNVIEHNEIDGTLNVWSNDGGGYSGTGIVLYADFRWGSAGTADMSGNYVIHNTVSLESSNEALVPAVAFEITDTRDDSNFAVIHDNAIGFNDFSDMDEQIAITPTSLDSENTIDQNLGENRSGSTHPTSFKPEHNN